MSKKKMAEEQARQLAAADVLADVDPPGRASEVGLLGDRDEILQLPQFHNQPF